MESKETTMCPRCAEMMDKTEKCIQEHPIESALTSLGAGLLLARLPLGLLMATLVRLVFCLLKPAVILYGIYRLAEDIHARQPEGGDAGNGVAEI